MARYRAIHTKIWSDPEFLDLNPPEKLIFIYLLANESLSESGLYPLPLRKIAFDTNIPLQGVTKALENLCKTSLIEYDWDNQIVWVVKCMKYKPYSTNVLKSINTDLEMNKKSPLINELINLYQGAWEGLASPSISPPIGLGLGIGLSISNWCGGGGEEPQNPERKKNEVELALPPEIPEEAWKDYIEMRKAIKAPMTKKAKELAIAKLLALNRQGNDPSEVLNQSVLNSWKGLFPLKATDDKEEKETWATQ